MILELLLLLNCLMNVSVSRTTLVHSTGQISSFRESTELIKVESSIILTTCAMNEFMQNLRG